MKTRNTLLYFISLCWMLTGCGKEFLDIRRDSGQVVPKKASDYLAILARSNMFFSSSDLIFLGTDEYYLKSGADLIAGSQYAPFHQYAYIWADDPYGIQSQNLSDWNGAYERIMAANLALDVETLPVQETDGLERDKARVAARFHRAWNFYHLAQVFCKVYDQQTAVSVPGLPLRTDYDVSVNYGRSSLADVYKLILRDLLEAEQIKLHGDNNTFLPGTLAVQALLARVYLQQGQYDLAFRYADLVLAKKNDIIDYGQFQGTISDVYSSYFQPYGKDNPSIIFFSYSNVGGILAPNYGNVDTLFEKSLESGDLRRKIYFFQRPDGSRIFTGSYFGNGGNGFFTGLTVEEMLLIRAECHARRGKPGDAINDINTLRRKRFEKADYRDIRPEELSDVLEYVLAERRKELYMRGRRWEDARRLNREGKYEITFRKKIDGKEHSLVPGSNKWVWPIPKNEMDNNDIEQNER